MMTPQELLRRAKIRVKEEDLMAGDMVLAIEEVCEEAVESGEIDDNEYLDFVERTEALL
jgi:hypothetical protein